MNQKVHLNSRGWRSFAYSLFLTLFSFSIATSVQAQNSCRAGIGRLGELKMCQTGATTSIQATQVVAATVPTGFQVLYVLTKGDSLIIQGVSRFPYFRVTPDANYTIHTLVYNSNTLDLSIVKPGVTTGFDVNGLLVQGGGNICAALDVAGAKFSFSACEEPCFATSGTIRPDTRACLDGDTLTLRATVATAPVVPDSFQVVYVLTRGDSLVIINAGAKPEFKVTAPGKYTIHTLVYNPSTLDLGIVELGVTTGVAVNGLLRQGGGSICAALDVAGAKFNVEICPCTATAGTLRPLSDGCLQSGSANLRAIQSTRPIVPAGYQVAYVLTRSDSLVIVGAGASPNFTVNAAGKYTIHTLVYNPATLDLGIVQPGVTTGFDVNALLRQGGGAICAALDVAGAKFEVSTAVCCKASAGTLNPLGSSACLQEGKATLAASIRQLPTVPTGYRLLYVLTSGNNLVIQQVNNLPLFTVRDTGRFTIHTLVYNPATLDLGIVKFGQTTGVDVNGLLIQGGGSICAALDVAGAPFSVKTCPCQVNIGRIVPQPNTCLSGIRPVRLKASILHQPSGPRGYRSLWVLTEGDSLIIRSVNTNGPEFYVNREGKYRIHTLTYNPATLDLSIVKLGQTTGFEVNSLLVQGGGSICAGLDVAGAAFEVKRCGSNVVGALQSSAVFPNPTKDLLNVQLGNNLGTGKITLEVLDLNGKITQRQNLDAGSTQAELDIHTLPAGLYYLRVFAEGQIGEMLKFNKQ
ncbi:MAG TPA: T9SS type A sorting domain-containing protein [Haliscomenobacter sp.]|uniref:T9SS type A sorting domain-containing protein n=1 Tax=Haliscomenobacter sp. TaxID=2717303 RepID=UPI002BE1F5CB|nr:T9SS type A sorting domain-containing protein [Haliscomenobacter sp.]HOY18515.1 T9SS type A sorting domain-containing protein [Haliscomenobacter sp.]HPH18310.1 T9SS type A sorting domain-containing protein [Haliscomenobacter sp.]